MKKKLLPIALLISAIYYSQNISFSDSNFKLFLLQADSNNQIAEDLNGNFFKIDSNNDNEISISEAQNVGKLSLKNTSITSIEGILNFSNLTELQNETATATVNLKDLTSLRKYHGMSNIYLTSLNFQGCSSLTEVSCQYNYNLTSINLSQCTNLIYLAASHCYNLQSLDLQHLINIEKINLQETDSLTHLDFSCQSKLQELTVSGTSLSSLIIKNGANETVYFDYCPSLQTICADISQIQTLQNSADNYGYTSININSNCSNAACNSATLYTNETPNFSTQITLYPNPASEFLFFKNRSEDVKIEKIEFLDLGGNYLYSSKNTDNKVNISNLKTGLYYIKFYFKDKKTEVQKFLKK